ncbi:MAG: hypothetical protein IT176_01015 [Acidobacteria bacterium]|nr:hypothetical protein [Acidobacteriota bacterium]
MVGLINQYRAGKGLSQLAVSQPLQASSVWKSLHMAGYGYFAHDDPAPPVGRSASQRARDCGYGGSWWGENIAWGYTSAQAVVNGWLGSSGHRANIENPNFTSTGVGVAANASGQLYWTQNFGNDTATTPPPPPPPTGDTQKPSAPAGLTVSSIGQTSLQLRWRASSDNVGVSGYGIYVGGSRIGTTTGTAVSVSGFACGGRYAVGVDAVDAAGNRSAVTTATVTMAACGGGGPVGDTVAPTTPAAITVTSTSRTSVAVRWSASSDNVAVTGYRLYRGSVRVATTAATAYMFAGLACGTRYVLGVEAIDAAGNVSARRVVTVSTRSCRLFGGF